MHRALVLAPLALLLPAAADDAPQPGAWRQTTSFAVESVDGRPMAPAGAAPANPAEMVCHSAEDLSEPARLFLTDRSIRCAEVDTEMANGRIAFNALCGQGDVAARIKGEGRYTPDRYDVTVTGTTRTGGVTVAFRSTVTAQRTGDCPAGG